MLKREALAKLYATKQGKYKWHKWNDKNYIYYNTKTEAVCWADGNIYSNTYSLLDEEGWEEYKEPVVVVGLEALFKKHKELGKQKTYWHCSALDTVMYVENIPDGGPGQQICFDISDTIVCADSFVTYATYTLVDK